MENAEALEIIENMREKLTKVRRGRVAGYQKKNNLKYREAILRLLLKRVVGKYSLLGFSLKIENCDELTFDLSKSSQFCVILKKIVLSYEKNNTTLHFVPENDLNDKLMRYKITLHSEAIDENEKCIAHLFWMVDNHTSGYWALTYKDRMILSEQLTDEYVELLLGDMSQATGQ
ncbi:hypothetical protein [Klebsiella quasipneumoniae]|uniref:hypothetical protein n=1 Tax=Klebsiella quasipneumoniae TaxID=1463165 RepID=UPI001C2C81A9|nr:hypothetical protein [Klebsiella quasipneumoniae]MBV0364525.1 hypothetical protein [Klebsiella quasipneumoniae]MDT9767233.1 hypothetical protein [Klebsiella quasipneumoniae]MDV0812418.1 hypothetical protein [Klebsiella quasipneumoniae subsp. quasipneumoniae]MDW3817968.1 hypothetical protein [Klebsiella quasipneumoniae]MDZ2306907.1 hypothetical protein [Klebsiella quasipneumoniae]